MNKDTGGPAFPVPGLQHDSDFNGIDMRDYFAAKAMTMKFGSRGTTSELLEHAKDCYAMADAMLEARKS